MHYIVVCLDREFCGWSAEWPKEEYDLFDYLCPECYGPAVTYTSRNNIEPEEVLGFLLPLIDGEAGDSEESME
jgi:hypothetical protein